MTQIRDRVFAITGAASGIGRALAIELAALGGHVAISDIDSAGLTETRAACEEHGVRVHSAMLDVADRDAVHQWADDVVDHHGCVHAIVNNAGVNLRATVEDMAYDDFEWLMNINFWGVVHGTKAFLPHIRAAGEGNIVNISSVFGIIGVPTQSAYNASKFAVRGFTEALRMEIDLEGLPIGVTSVHPGGIKTNIARNGRIHAMSRFEDEVDLIDDFDNNLARTTPEDAAKAIVAGIVGNKHRVLIGLDAYLIDRGQRAAPIAYQKIVAKVVGRNFRLKKRRN